MRLYRIRIEKGSDYGLVRSLVAQTGAEVLSFEKNMMVVGANGAFVDAITEVDDVASVSNFIMREKHNEYGAGNIMGANLANSSGYDGSTQTVAVADTGLGGGTTDNSAPRYPNRPHCRYQQLVRRQRFMLEYHR